MIADTFSFYTESLECGKVIRENHRIINKREASLSEVAETYESNI